MINILMILLGVAIANCQQKQDAETFKIVIDKPNEEKLITIKLKKIYPSQAMRIVENTLDDTCMIGIMKVPPGKQGQLYKIEFFGDTLSYKYTPFKASKGKLILEHGFMKY